MNDCIISNRCKNKSGYANIRFNGKVVFHHRLVYALNNNLDIFNMGGVVMHSCDNPSCININHLSLGSQIDNINDKVNKDRQVKGDRHPNAKISKDEIEYILKNYIPKSVGECGNGKYLIKKFNISYSHLSRIINKKVRLFDTKDIELDVKLKKRLSNSDVKYIKENYIKGSRSVKGNSKELMAMFNIGKSGLSHIVTGSRHKNLIIGDI